MNRISVSIHKNRVIHVFSTAVMLLTILIGCTSAPMEFAISTTPAPGTVNSATSDFQVYRNQQEGYSISIPTAWIVSTSDVGAAYFLTQEGLNLRSKEFTDWEASVAGIQVVGRNEQLDKNAQYESILPNHCDIVEWSAIEVGGIAGRKYSLECDNVASTGTHREEHVYVPSSLSERRSLQFGQSVLHSHV